MKNEEKDRDGPGVLPWAAIVFSLGLFTLASQTIIFRSYLFSFEGNELGVGSFFGSWLTWVALGALAARFASRRWRLPRGGLALLALLYLPAFILQDTLIENIRSLAGVAVYEVFPLGRMLSLSILANGPVSFLTGFLFTVACVGAPTQTGSRTRSALPVARVFVLEALGSFVGGVVVTILLWAGAAEETVFLVAALPLAGSVTIFHLCQGDLSFALRLSALMPLLLIAAALAGGLGGRWARLRDLATWERLLPEESYRGSFRTAQSRYLYGEREGQFLVVSWGGVTETVPDVEHASEVVATHLAQRPETRRVMVVGEGALSLCLRFAKLTGIERVAWLHPDPEYPRALWEVLPDRVRDAARKVEVPDLDARKFVEAPPYLFDLIVLDLPDVTSLVLNRYATAEFFGRLQGALTPGGIVSVRISGGENYLGGELVHLGSSMLATLESRFAAVALRPGEESWLLASDGEGLTSSPGLLRDRFGAIPGAREIYPPEGLLSLYPPDRIDFQMEAYRRQMEETGEEILINTERRPKALLYGLAVGLRRAGPGGIARHLPVLLAGLSWICASGILLYAILRCLYLLRSSSLTDGRTVSGDHRLFDASVLIFTTGMAGMALGVVLMFLYQARFGSLYLHVGLVASLFMLGLFLGSALARGRLEKTGKEPRSLVPLCIGIHLVVMLTVAALPGAAPREIFGLLFVLAGAASGAYFPVAAHRLQEAGRGAAAAGSRLEIVDHLGGAAGAALAGWVLLPVCGTGATLALLALLVAMNLMPGLVKVGGARPEGGDAFDRTLRPVAFWGLGLAAFLLIASQIAAIASAGREGRLLEVAARILSPSPDLEARSAVLGDGTGLQYFITPDPAEGVGGYIFGTGRLAGDVYGYGGPMEMAVHVDPDGVLLGFEVVRSRETPAYLEMTRPWQEGLLGRNIFGPGAFHGVDAVTGATMTASGMTGTLEKAGRRFAGEVLGREVGELPPEAPSPWVPDGRFLCLLALASVALISRYLPHRWLRRLYLVVALLVTGLWLNLQYSTQQVFSLLSLQLPAFGLSAAFFTVVIVPALVLLLGNIYCGYICPFGALQELLGDLKGRKVSSDPGKEIWRWGRGVKYALLALLAVAFALTRDPGVLQGDPLITFFSGLSTGRLGSWAFALGAAGVCLSLIFRRFWCRNLCPAGAFLALVGGVKLLARFLPQVRPRRCDLGVRTASDLDCLGCDRCRDEAD